MITNVSVGFSTTAKWISGVIRWITRGRVSHAWISFYDPCLDTRFVMQAEWWGYELRPRARWERENLLVAEYELPDLDMVSAVLSMTKEIGSPYDWWSAFWSGAKSWLRRWFGSRFSLRPSRTPHQLMCSEAVARILADAGFPFQEGILLELVSPTDLEKVVRESGLSVQIRGG